MIRVFLIKDGIKSFTGELENQGQLAEWLERGRAELWWGAPGTYSLEMVDLSKEVEDKKKAKQARIDKKKASLARLRELDLDPKADINVIVRHLLTYILGNED